MTPQFNVRFLIDRATPEYRLILTDLSDYSEVTAYYGFFKITYPDGVVVENTSVSSPDISNTNAVLNIPLRLRKDLILGDYTVTFKVYADDVLFEATKAINLSFYDLPLMLSDNSTIKIPTVSFLDVTNTVVSNYNGSIARTISCDYPNGGSISTPAVELFMAKEGLYYEGLYEPTLTYDAIYTGTNHEVQWKNIKEFKFEIRGFLGFEELLKELDIIKNRLDYGNGNKVEFKDDYYMATSIYTHILARFSNDLAYASKVVMKDFNLNGTTAERPILSTLEVGISYFDTTLGYPIYKKDNTTWVNSLGVAV